MVIVFLAGGLVGLSGALVATYVLQSTQVLLALRADTGRLAWFHPFGTKIYSQGPLVGEGTVLLSYCQSKPTQATDPPDCGAYQLRAFDTQSGRTLWTYTPQGKYSSFQAVTRQSVLFENGQVLVQVRDRLDALQLATGRVRWSRPRFWFSREAGYPPYTIGVLHLPERNQLVVQQRQSRQRLVQLLNPATGKLVHQFTIFRGQLTTIDERFKTNQRSLFVQSSELLPGAAKNTFFSSERSTLSAYNPQTGRLQFRQTVTGDLGDIQVADNILHLTTFTSYNSQRQLDRGQQFFWALDGNTGRILWHKSGNQLGCQTMGLSKRVLGNTVYLSCNPQADTASTAQRQIILSLAARTGQVQWQSIASPNRYVEEFPNAVNAKQLFTIRRLGNSESTADATNSNDANSDYQDQVIALNRPTGNLRWSMALYNSEDISRFRAVVAADEEHFFLLTRLPRWQIWLLQLNPSWYLKQPEQPESIIG